MDDSTPPPTSPEILGDDLPVLETTELVPCRHLRSKAMYVYENDLDELGGHDNSIYWCLQTMKNFGPDDEHVNGRDCRSPGRACYEPL